MLDTRSLGSLIFWGPPGTGKTTVARLLADETEPAFRADFRDLLRRRRPQEGVRRGARAARDRAGDAAVRRRDPPLQPRAAGLLPAGDGGRHHRAGRRHHRKSVVRAESRRCCRARACWCSSRSTPRRSRSCWRAPRRIEGKQLPLDADARASLDPHGRRRRPRRADAGRGSLARRARRRDLRRREACRRSCSGARRSTTSRRTATTT